MKIIKILFVIFTTLLIILIIGANHYLQNGLNNIIQTKLPDLEKELNVQLSLKDISLNLFAGSLNIKHLEIGNPSGFIEQNLFSIESCRQDIGLSKLITSMALNIEEIEATDASLNIIRNKNSEINILKFLRQLNKKAKSKENHPASDAQKTDKAKEDQKSIQTEKPFKTSRISLDKLDINSTIKVIDHLSKSPFSLDFDMIFKGRNIKNFGIEQDKGGFSITGSLSQNKELFITSIKGSISPILNPSKPSFDMTGTINTIDLKLFEDFLKETKLIEGMVDLSINVNCQKGVFDTSTSKINIHMKKLIFEEDTFPEEIETPKEISVKIPIRGTLEEPDVDIERAMQRALIKLINPEKMLRNLIKKELSGKENKIEKELGRFFGDNKKAEEVTQSLQNLFK